MRKSCNKVECRWSVNGHECCNSSLEKTSGVDPLQLCDNGKLLVKNHGAYEEEFYSSHRMFDGERKEEELIKPNY